MTLIEFIQSLPSADGDHVIYAEPRWRPDSTVYVSAEPADGTLPAPARGMTYLVSVSEAKRIVRARRQGGPSTPAELARAIIYYGIYDCAEPVAVAV